MATKADFTEDEWDALQKGVTGAGMLVAAGERGFFDTFKEAGALARHLKDAREKNTSELVRELAAVRGTGFGFIASPNEVEGESIEALRTAVKTLEAKAPEELDDYRSFVIAVSESVAEAAKGVGAGETKVLDKIREALGAA